MSEVWREVEAVGVSVGKGGEGQGGVWRGRR